MAMYLTYKLIHVLAVIMFLGNIVTGLFWKSHGDRTRNLQIMSHTLAGIIRSDRWFTIPGVIVIILAGIAGAIEGRVPMFGTGWVLWSLVAFSLSGIAFAWRVAPLQKQLVAMTQNANDSTFDWQLYRSKSLQWELWGLFATVTPLIAVALMVMKPKL
jgi:uncharacterized membrane protein